MWALVPLPTRPRDLLGSSPAGGPQIREGLAAHEPVVRLALGQYHADRLTRRPDRTLDRGRQCLAQRPQLLGRATFREGHLDQWHEPSSLDYLQASSIEPSRSTEATTTSPGPTVTAAV